MRLNKAKESQTNGSAPLAKYYREQIGVTGPPGETLQNNQFPFV